ncbi:MAG: hypothetical protein LBT47_05865 [Deltaproteobacteria bacterium]|jgi:dihydroorotate dehydrogenase electron transfer subunit|nr:hypothetical protein [Deltaproteobacteria bacterium]
MTGSFKYLPSAAGAPSPSEPAETNGWSPAGQSFVLSTPTQIIETLVADNAILSSDTFLLTLGTAPDQAAPKGLLDFPALGRFARLRAWPEPGGGSIALLDRPFSVHRVTAAGPQFLIRAVGPATELLKALPVGSPVRLLGPLGRGLDAACPDFIQKSWYLVAGGAGLGPMASLVDTLGSKARLFYGERTAGNQVSQWWLNSWAGDYAASCDDGTGYGAKGPITLPLAEALQDSPRPIFACGPLPMLKAIAKLAKSYGVEFFAGAETRMACGLGVCMSCSVAGIDGQRLRLCLDGPVIDAHRLDWEVMV